MWTSLVFGCKAYNDMQAVSVVGEHNYKYAHPVHLETRPRSKILAKTLVTNDISEAISQSLFTSDLDFRLFLPNK